jgi:iron complex outermembrane receptor protein
LPAAVSSLTYQQGNNPTNTNFRIRGIGTALFDQGVEGDVSVVVDGVVAARQTQDFFDLADVDRVEVLSGPQGTLFGPNSAAGLINVITAAPSWAFGAKASIEAAQPGQYRADATVTGPLSDVVAARLTGYYDDIGGYIRNVATGRALNGGENAGVRGKLQWNPLEGLEVLASADYYRNNSTCCQGILIATTNANLAKLLLPVVVSESNHEINDEGLSYANTWQQTFSLRADWTLTDATLTSITAYQKFSAINNVEVDALYNPQPIYVGATGGTNFSQFNLNRGVTTVGQLSQELRAASPVERPLSYVAGVYYMRFTVDRAFQRRAAYCAAGAPAQLGATCAPSLWVSAASSATETASQVAAFAQSDLRLASRWKLSAGLRVQHEQIAESGQQLGPIDSGDVAFGSKATAPAGASDSDTTVTGKAALQYEFSPHTQSYASYTRGYKGPGYDIEITADFGNERPIEPESVNAYEIGLKTESLDRRLSLSGALFFAGYKNLQVQVNQSNPATGLILYVPANAGSATTQGVELQSEFHPTEPLAIDLSATYSHARVDIDGVNCPVQFQASAPVVGIGAPAPVNSCYRQQTRTASGALATSGPLQNVRDGWLPASPEWHIDIASRYTFLRARWTGVVQIAAEYQSAQQFAIEQDPGLIQHSYTLVNPSVWFGADQDRLRLTFFVKNLFDQHYFTSLTRGAVADPLATLAYIPKDAYRYFGVTLDLHL